MSVQAEKTSQSRIVISSPYWQLGVDLARGGALDRIIFPHGSSTNLLMTPLRTSVDEATDVAGPAEEGVIEETERGARITCSGRLSGSDGQLLGIRYQHVYEIDEDTLLIQTTLDFGQDIEAKQIGIGEGTFVPSLSEYGYRPSPWADPEGGKWCRATWGRVNLNGWPVVASSHVPFYWMLFQRYVEGLDWSPASDFGDWEEQLSDRRGQSSFSLLGRQDGSGIELECKVLQSDEPVTIPAGFYTYSYYLGLPKIMERTPRKWYHLSFGNHPWPSDETIRHWAEAGVNVVRLHNDYAPDGNFWHDGAWPPYDDAGMAEVRRVIGTCHQHGIKVIPYFSIHELHPVSSGYEHEQEWCRTMAPDQTPYHNYVRNGEYGVQMCPQSDWLDTLKRNVERAYRELGFDGIYYDWMHYMPCMNHSHAEIVHSGVDGVIDMGRWTRDLIGDDGVLVLHIYGDFPSIPLGNMADLLVCMEETSNQQDMYYHWQDLPLATVLGETVPRSPCPPYRRDHRETRLKSLIAQLSVMGLFHADGGAEDTLRYFAAFSRYPLHEYRFRGAWTRAVETSDESVRGAVYFGPGHALLVLSNTVDVPATDVTWRLNLSEIGWGDAGRYRLTVPSLGDQCQETSGSQLSGTGLRLSLPGLEYQVIEIEPVGA